MLGIPKYEPNFYEDPFLFRKVVKNSFCKLIGKKIRKYWVMWDEIENEWYPHGPVILEIEGNHHEFCAYQLDDFSYTLNKIDLQKKLEWYGASGERPLTWKENGIEELQISLDRPILSINVLTFNFKSMHIETQESHETGFMMHGIEFELQKEQKRLTYFSIYNALDKNGLSAKRVEQNDQIERIKITK